MRNLAKIMQPFAKSLRSKQKLQEIIHNWFLVGQAHAVIGGAVVSHLKITYK